MNYTVRIIERKQGVIQIQDNHAGLLSDLQDLKYLEESPCPGNALFQLFSSTQDNSNKPIAPAGQGLVVIDFESKWIGSLSYPLELEYWDFNGLWNSATGKIHPEYAHHFEYALEHQAVPGVKIEKSIDGKYINHLVPIPKKWKRAEEALSWIKEKSREKEVTSFKVLYQPPHWTVQEFGLNHMLEMAQLMIEKEFNIEPFLKDWEHYLPRFARHQSIHFIEEITYFLKERLNQKIPLSQTIKNKKIL